MPFLQENPLGVFAQAKFIYLSHRLTRGLRTRAQGGAHFLTTTWLAQATARTTALESTTVACATPLTLPTATVMGDVFAASAMPCRRRSHKRTTPACEPSVTHVPSAEHRAATFADSPPASAAKKLATVGYALRTSTTSTR